MRYVWLGVVALFALAHSTHSATGRPEREHRLRVGVRSLEGSRWLELTVRTGSFRVRTLDKAEPLLVLQPGQKLRLDQKGADRIGLVAPGLQASVPELWLAPATPGSTLLVRSASGARHLLGHLECRAQGSLLLVNELPLEDYLRGVVPSEMFPSWEMEALKSQAILARTYTLVYQTQRKRHTGFDLCDKAHCQVYLGLDNETRRTTQAVLETRGQILTYQGAPANIFYHSTCGGATALPGAVFHVEEAGGLPVQKIVADQSRSRILCSISPHYSWDFRLPKAQFQRFLEGLGILHGVTGRVTKIRILGRDGTGRISRIEMVGSTGSFTMTGHEFRLEFMERFGRESLKSTLFFIAVESGNIVLRGRGFGHGVGVCQWGAQGLAEQGYKYRAILRHYYPDSDLQQIGTILAGD